MSSLALACVVFNVLIGTGAFCLPASMHGVPMSLAAAVVCAIGVLSGASFWLVGRLCERSGARSFDELWIRAGPPFGLPAWVPQAVLVGLAAGSCLQFTISLAELLSPYAGGALAGASGATPMLVLLVALPLLPALFAWRDLRSLQASALVGASAKLLAAALMLLRAVDGSYRPGGRFFAESAAAVAAAGAGGLMGSPIGAGLSGSAALWKVIGSVGVLNTAFMCHFDAPRYFGAAATSAAAEQPVPRRGPVSTVSTGSTSAAAGPGWRGGEASVSRIAHLPIIRASAAQPAQRVAPSSRFATITAATFSAGSLIYLMIIAAARATFGEHTPALALAGYASSDPLAVVANVLCAIGVMSSYLLTMLALKSALAGGSLGRALTRLLGGSGSGVVGGGQAGASAAGAGAAAPRAERSLTPAARDRRLSALVWTTVTTLAVLGADKLLFVVQLRGAILGSLLIYVLPALIGLGLGKGSSSRRHQFGLLALGVYGALALALSTSHVLALHAK